MDFLRSVKALRSNSVKEREAKLQKKLQIKEMPYVYGLMAVASSSGLSAESSIRCIGGYLPMGVIEHFQKLIREIDRGKSFREAISKWNDIEHLRPLSHILIESMESGTSALPAMDAMARDANSKIRRHAESAIKRLPVTMLFPLVFCILPAFILLSIIPTLISGFTSFSW